MGKEAEFKLGNSTATGKKITRKLLVAYGAPYPLKESHLPGSEIPPMKHFPKKKNFFLLQLIGRNIFYTESPETPPPHKLKETKVL